MLKTANIADMLLSWLFINYIYIEIVHIFVILGCERFLTWCQECIPPPRKHFFFFHSIISNKLIRNIFIFLGLLIIPMPLFKTANIADTLFSCSFENFGYTFIFGLCMVFNHVLKWHPTPIFFVSLVLLLTSPSTMFIYFWGWLIIPTSLLKTINIVYTIFLCMFGIYTYTFIFAYLWFSIMCQNDSSENLEM